MFAYEALRCQGMAGRQHIDQTFQLDRKIHGDDGPFGLKQVVSRGPFCWVGEHFGITRADAEEEFVWKRFGEEANHGGALSEVPGSGKRNLLLRIFLDPKVRIDIKRSHVVILV